MSDLQCAARVFVARHGEADYETDLLTDDGGSLSARGPPAVARRWRRRWRASGSRTSSASPLSRAVQTAEIAAAVLGVDVTVREGLREFGGRVARRAAAADPDPFRPSLRRLARRAT